MDQPNEPSTPSSTGSTVETQIKDLTREFFANQVAGKPNDQVLAKAKNLAEGRPVDEATTSNEAKTPVQVLGERLRAIAASPGCKVIPLPSPSPPSSPKPSE